MFNVNWWPEVVFCNEIIIILSKVYSVERQGALDSIAKQGTWSVCKQQYKLGPAATHSHGGKMVSHSEYELIVH